MVVEDRLQFEYYVLNYDHNKKEIIHFNIFSNCWVQTRTEKDVKKYLRAPSKFTYHYYDTLLSGFDALCERIRTTIICEEWARCEYEIAVGNHMAKDLNEFRKIDCYYQCAKNIPMITREVIYQYKEYQKKHGKT